MNLLFTCAGRRNYLLEYFKKALQNNGTLVGVDMQLSAPALAVADKAFAVPSIYSTNYIDSILEICQSEKISALFSLNDLELPILANARSQFEKIGVKLVISSEEVIEICFDKWKTFEFAQICGLNVPKTYLSIDLVKGSIDKGELSFPLVVKPRWGSASIGIEFPESLVELELAYKLLSLRLSRTILAQASKNDIAHAILIQEKMQGKEFGLDVLNNFEGKPLQVYVKEKMAMRAGETDKAILRNNPDLQEVGFKIGETLGHIGNLDCDIFEKDDNYYLLELNPRFGGGYPFSQMAGANYPEAIVSWLNGKPYDFSKFTCVYDQPYAKCDTLIPVKKD